jgi:glyoxylase-like metal-dependent hydrolase (beta-lactamase superfamily II)
MKRRLLLAVAIALLPVIQARTQDAAPSLDAAAAALGAANLRTIQYSGWGSDYIFGQAYDGSAPWPRFNLPSYTVSIDFTAPALRDERRRAQAENPPRGGGFQPLLGEQRQIWALSGSYAWDIVGQEAVPAPLERDLRTAVEGRTAQVWLTPHGFIKAAAAGRATARVEEVRGAKKTLIMVTTPTGVRLEGVLDDRNLVERIETRLAHPMLGDVLYEAIFDEYADFGGVTFPTRIRHREGGYPVLDVTITNVTPNAAVAIDVPEHIRQARPAAPAPIVPERLSDGVWMLPGGAKSVAVEFRDHVVLVEAPEGEARSLAVMAAVEKVIPGKPIRYVINTHSHFDHASGLRTFAAEGATIVTHRENVPYYEQIWSYPRTIAPDRLARSGRAASLEGVVGARTFDDGSRRLVVYHYGGNLHNAGMLMAFLPRERILIEADSYTPPPGPNDPPGGLAFLTHFYEAVEALRLDVDQVVPIHGRLVTLDEVRQAVERFGETQLWRN